jgi:hypothetical protein
VILTKLVIVLCLKTFNLIKLRFFGIMSSESPDAHCAVYVMGVFYMQGQRQLNGASFVTGLSN